MSTFSGSKQVVIMNGISYSIKLMAVAWLGTKFILVTCKTITLFHPCPRAVNNLKFGGLMSDFFSPHVDVSLGKILNPELLPMVVPTVYECVNEC